jgi:hypothetical protein
VDTFAALVLHKAFRLAHEANAGEIMKQHLLVALNEIDQKIPVPPAPTGGPYIPVPHQDLPLAQDVVTIVTRIGGLERMTGESLRAALEQSK